MPETRIQATEAHYGLLVDIDQGKVYDDLTSLGETPRLRMPGETPADVSKLVWDLETLGWVWRPAVETRWQLTDAGRQAMEGSGL